MTIETIDFLESILNSVGFQGDADFVLATAERIAAARVELALARERAQSPALALQNGKG